jgi:hypothetical protein
MGSFYTSVSYRRVAQDRVISAIQARFPKRSCFVSPNLNNWVTVYDRDSGEYGGDVLLEMARVVSRECRCAAFGFNLIDSDVLEWWAFDDKGGLVSKSEVENEAVTWAEEHGLAGEPGCLPGLFGLKATGEAIRAALTRDEVFRDDNASALGNLLGIANMLSAYRYLLEEGNDEDVVGWSEFVHLGPSPNDEVIPNWSVESFNLDFNVTGQADKSPPSPPKPRDGVQDLLPGDRIKVIDGTFVGLTGLVVSRQEAMAMWEKAGGEKPGPIDPAGGVWVRVSVFDRPIIVLLDRSQMAACDDS